MSESNNDGGPAFPSPAFDNCALPGCEGGPMRGMTLRDYFAAVALQGIHASSINGYPSPAIAAKEAYEAADAMLAERSK